MEYLMFLFLRKVLVQCVPSSYCSNFLLTHGCNGFETKYMSLNAFSHIAFYSLHYVLFYFIYQGFVGYERYIWIKIFNRFSYMIALRDRIHQ